MKKKSRAVFTELIGAKFPKGTRKLLARAAVQESLRTSIEVSPSDLIRRAIRKEIAKLLRGGVD